MADALILHQEGDSPPSRPRGVSHTKPIDAAKEAVSVPELVERLSGPGVRRGKEVFFRCPLHDDRNPSLRVDPEKQVWYCDPCGVGGDVVELARLTWDHDYAVSAAADLLLSFGHPLPERPPSWFRRQERHASVREAIDRERVEHIRMLVFRLVWVPWLRTLPSWVRDEAKESAWDRSWNIALRLYESRRSA